MKKETIEFTKGNSKNIVEYYKNLYDIDKKIIDGGTDECSKCLEFLLKLKGDVIIEICMWDRLREGKFLKRIENEIDDLLWNIDIRIKILSNMDLEDVSKKCSFLEQYREIYNPSWKSKLWHNICSIENGIYTSEIITFYICLIVGISAVNILHSFNIDICEGYDKYVVLLTYVYFLLGRAKKISSDGIRLWKPKNWKENIRN